MSVHSTDTLNIEPNWPGVLRWAENGLKTAAKPEDVGHLIQVVNVLLPNLCNEPLWDNGHVLGLCSRPRFIEHSHHDHTAAEAISAGLARGI